MYESISWVYDDMGFAQSIDFVYLIGVLLLFGASPNRQCSGRGGVRHVGLRVLLVLFHCLCQNNNNILSDQSG